MRIGVLTLDQTTGDRPGHWVSKVLATLICSEKRYGLKTRSVVYTAIWLKNDMIKLQTEETIRELKDRFKKTKLAVIPIHAILPPLEHYDCVAAPYPVRDMSSYALRSIREIWGCNQDEWQQRIGLS